VRADFNQLPLSGAASAATENKKEIDDDRTDSAVRSDSAALAGAPAADEAS